MKNLLLVLLSMIVLQSCAEVQTINAIADGIKKVETNLTTPVFIVGDSTWTIEERMQHYGVPGVSITVIHKGKIEWTKTYGVMDKESEAPVTKKTLFQAGSISKPVAAYGALRLVEQNKIALEADINTYLTSWKLDNNEFTDAKKVTLKNLLNHSAGVTVHGFLGYSPDLPVPTLVEVLNGTPPANSGAIFVNKVPEEGFRYSGGGYTIMQQMMIDIENKTFPLLMDELVLNPLKMNTSTYDQPLQSDQLAFAATGYLPDGSMTKGKRHTYPEMAAAGLWTTSEDLAKFAVNLQQSVKEENNVALSHAMTSMMLTPFVEEFSGLGIFLNTKGNEIYFGHGGWDEGFSSELIAHKDKGYGVVVLTNSNHPEFISELIRSVALSYAWDEYLPVYTQAEPDPAQFEEVKGRYRINGNRVVEVYPENNRLYRKGLGEKATELIKISDTTFVRREGSQLVQFKTNAEKDSMALHLLNANDGSSVATFTRMKDDEKLPIEFLVEGDFEKALGEYQELMKKDKDDPTIAENNLNGLGYQFLSNEKAKIAQAVFKVNIALYPNSFNVYDSYAEACMKLGENELAIENYQKSIRLDPKNLNAKRMIERLEKAL